MTLLQIWNSRPAWITLSELRKPPGIAYRLLKYERLVDAEFAVITKSRDAMITKAAGVEAGQFASLQPDSPEYAAFSAELTAFLATESELQPCDLDMDALLAALDTQAGNSIAEGDLALLEPFFTQPVEAANVIEPIGSAFMAGAK